MLRNSSRNSPIFFPLHSSLNIQSLVLLNRVIDRNDERIVRAAQLPRGTRSPLPCVAKIKPKKNFHNPGGIQGEAHLHYTLSSYQRGEEQVGILPLVGVYSKVSEHGQLEDYLVTPECDLILSRCLGAIRDLELRNASLYQMIMFKILHGMVGGLSRLAEMRIVHNDLTLDNIGLFQNVWRIFDFGESESYEEFCGSLSHLKGSPFYIAPEICACEHSLPFARDVWALGQIFRQLLGQEVMFFDLVPQLAVGEFLKSKAVTYKNIREQFRKDNPSDEIYQEILLQKICQETSLLNGIRVLVASMCEILPEHRPSVETLQKAVIRFSSFISLEKYDISEYQSFLRALIEAHQASIKSEESLDSDGGGSPVVVVDLESNRASPNQAGSPITSSPPLVNKTLTPVESRQILDQLDVEKSAMGARVASGFF